MKVIILAGGSGTRLWPLSRTNYPKQFLKLINGRSLFQMTVERSCRLADLSQIYVVTNAAYKYLVLSQAEELGQKFAKGNVFLEPAGKNTLPAIFYGVREIVRRYGDDVVAVFPADHLLEDGPEFFQTVEKGCPLAAEYLLTFGVKPTKPHPGYGYIRPGEPLGAGYRAAEFKEKPDEKTARAYVEKGYLWNSGMFMFHTALFAEEVRRYCPEVAEAFRAEDVNEIFKKVPAVSIDYGVMEKSDRVAVLPLAAKWSDLGSFDTFFGEFPQDEKGNVVISGGVLLDTAGSLLCTDKRKLAVLVGVRDLIVVDEKDALLVCRKDKAQRVKEVVDRLKESGDSRADLHLTVYRPWGSYTVLEEGLFCKIKRVTVLPGKKLSRQLRHQCCEHWIVVRGTAKVTEEGAETLVESGGSVFVRSGRVYFLENPGQAPLEVIEVQLGEYLEEDDIARFEDGFGRG